ncbi:hypothetical protein [Xanthomonas cerealis]|uniref:hypothetical protein n=1 Tax=Xanthomonas cerealis TaxID=3390025 RepID=UPI00163BDF3B|nr:hypothetical protein [Xanthomonas translucens]
MTDIFMNSGLIVNLNLDALGILQRESKGECGVVEVSFHAAVMLRPAGRLNYIGDLKGQNLSTTLALSQKSTQYGLKSRIRNRMALATSGCTCVRMEPLRYSGLMIWGQKSCPQRPMEKEIPGESGGKRK